jgi:Putative adhesin
MLIPTLGCVHLSNVGQANLLNDNKRTMSRNRTGLVLLLTAVMTSPAMAQDGTWSWQKVIPAGQAIEIKGVIGDIVATAATGNQVRVIARKNARYGDAADVTIEVVEHARGVTICAVYPNSRRDDENECLAGARGNSNTRDNDTEVDFEVQVPQGVKFTGRTVTGRVVATGLTADVKASSVSGSVRVSTTGLVQASTVSGSIDVAMGRTDWTDRLVFSSVSGDITLQMPENLNTDVEVSTVSGTLESDWPMSTTRRRFGPRNMHGRIGSGGRELKLSTVSGTIELKKSN